jgi:hypothetical protein
MIYGGISTTPISPGNRTQQSHEYCGNYLFASCEATANVEEFAVACRWI